MLGGAAATAAAANLVPAGAAHAQATAYQDGYNKLATDDSKHSIRFYGRHQAGIATPPGETSSASGPSGCADAAAPVARTEKSAASVP